MTDTKPTPNAFKPHLLVALAKTAEFRADHPIPMREVYEPVFARMGITEDQYGSIPNGNRLQTHQWIGIAFRKLKLDEYTDQPKRGIWTLTGKGLTEAKRLLADEGEETPATVETEVEDSTPTSANTLLDDVVAAATPEAPAKAEPEATPEAEPTNVVELRRPDARAYHTDPHIRSLAIASTKCFGYHSSRARACKTCPLAAECVQAVRAEFARLGAKVEKEESDAIARKMAEERIKKAAASRANVSTDALLEDLEATGTGAVKGKKRKRTVDRKARAQAKWDKSTAVPITARNNTKCTSCDKVLENGTKVLWIEEAGTFHQECLK
jgi:hypothetical protein